MLVRKIYKHMQKEKGKVDECHTEENNPIKKKKSSSSQVKLTCEPKIDHCTITAVQRSVYELVINIAPLSRTRAAV